MNKVANILILLVATFVVPILRVDTVSAQIQDLESLVEIQVWYALDERGGLVRLMNSWNRGPFLVAAECIADPEFVEAALKLSNDEERKLNAYLKAYFRKQDEMDQSVWHYPPPGFDRYGVFHAWLADARTDLEKELPFVDQAILDDASRRHRIVLLGFESVVLYPNIFPELKLAHSQQNEILAAIRKERTLSSQRAIEYNKRLVEEIESILDESQRQEFKRFYRDDVMSLNTLWELLLAQIELDEDSSLIQHLQSDEQDSWLLLPNQWTYRFSGRLDSGKFVSEHAPIPKTKKEEETSKVECDRLKRLLEFLENSQMAELLELSPQQEFEIVATRESLTELSTTNVLRYELVQQEMIDNGEIPEGELDAETGRKVREKFLKKTNDAILNELRPVGDLLVPRQRQQLETVQVKVETRAVGILSSFRWGQLGRSLKLSERQLEGLDKLRKIKRTQLAKTIEKEEDLFWECLNDVWTEQQKELIMKVQCDSMECFRPAPGLLLMESQRR